MPCTHMCALMGGLDTVAKSVCACCCAEACHWSSQEPLCQGGVISKCQVAVLCCAV